MITLDDAESTPAQSISQLKALICSKHGVHNTTAPSMSVFHGRYSVHSLQTFHASGFDHRTKAGAAAFAIARDEADARRRRGRQSRGYSNQAL